MKFKNLNCDETQKLKFYETQKHQIVMKLKKTQIMMKLNKSNCDEPQKLKL